MITPSSLTASSSFYQKNGFRTLYRIWNFLLYIFKYDLEFQCRRYIVKAGPSADFTLNGYVTTMLLHDSLVRPITQDLFLFGSHTFCRVEGVEYPLHQAFIYSSTWIQHCEHDVVDQALLPHVPGNNLHPI